MMNQSLLPAPEHQPSLPASEITTERPLPWVLVERDHRRGVTFAVVNMTGCAIECGGVRLTSAIPFNEFRGDPGPRQVVASQAARREAVAALTQIVGNPEFEALLKQGAVVAFLAAFERDLGFAVAEEMGKFMRAHGAAPVTQTILHAVEVPTVYDNARQPEAFPIRKLTCARELLSE